MSERVNTHAKTQITYNINLVQIKGYDLITANTLTTGLSRVACYVSERAHYRQVRIKN